MICLREVVGDEVVDLLEVRLQAAARGGWALLLEIIIIVRMIIIIISN